MKKVLVTGAAGFIGFHTSRRLAEMGYGVTGVDNLNEYYDVSLKKDRLARLEGARGFAFRRLDICDRSSMAEVFESGGFDAVLNMAAQAGVRYSLVNPHAYIESNVEGFLNVLECSRLHGVGHLVFASSSSVYGSNTKIPFSTHDFADHPMSLYGATKKAGEMMAHSYASLYGLPCTGLRFFTVYGPWGRPDMAYFLFTKAILEGRPIDVYNQGEMKRDFTYIDDIVEGIVRAMEKPPAPAPGWDSGNPDPASSYAPYRLYNIGNNRPVDLLHFIEVVEKCLGRKAVVNLLPMQPGDVPMTYADIDDLQRDVGFRPSTPIQVGMERFVRWYREYYG